MAVFLCKKFKCRKDFNRAGISTFFYFKPEILLILLNLYNCFNDLLSFPLEFWDFN